MKCKNCKNKYENQLSRCPYCGVPNKLHKDNLSKSNFVFSQENDNDPYYTSKSFSKTTSTTYINGKKVSHDTTYNKGRSEAENIVDLIRSVRSDNSTQNERTLGEIVHKNQTRKRKPLLSTVFILFWFLFFFIIPIGFSIAESFSEPNTQSSDDGYAVEDTYYEDDSDSSQTEPLISSYLNPPDVGIGSTSFALPAPIDKIEEFTDFHVETQEMADGGYYIYVLDDNEEIVCDGLGYITNEGRIYLDTCRQTDTMAENSGFTLRFPTIMCVGDTLTETDFHALFGELGTAKSVVEEETIYSYTSSNVSYIIYTEDDVITEITLLIEDFLDEGDINA